MTHVSTKCIDCKSEIDCGPVYRPCNWCKVCGKEVITVISTVKESRR